MEEVEGEVFSPELRLLARLVEARCHVAGDLIEVDGGIWAIHGSIPVGGEVIMAEFSLRDEARAVLDRLGPNQPSERPRERDGTTSREREAMSARADRPEVRQGRR